MSEEDPKFTRFERYQLSIQLRILEALYPDEAESIAVQREAIEHGYELLYRWQMEHIYDGDDVMTREECLEVWNTLDMFDIIGRSISEIGKPEYKEHFAAKFAGYDGNNESKFMGFAAFTVERQKRFEYVRVERGWNSHFPARQMYLRMLEVLQSLNLAPQMGGNLLSEAQLIQVLDAATHPDQRNQGE